MTELFLGIDGGGTKCEARLEDAEGNVLGQASSGPANVASDIERALDSVADVTQQVLAQAGLSQAQVSNTHACMGFAGIGVVGASKAKDAEDVLKPALMSRSLCFASVRFTNDLYIACYGAHKGQDGAAIVIGTGSAAMTLINQRGALLGGHGFILGDQGSGAWLGREAANLALLELDGLAKQSEISGSILSFYECRNQRDLVSRLAKAPSWEFAKFAPVLIKLAQGGDAKAVKLMQEAASYIDSLAQSILENRSSLRLSLIGGLVEPMRPFLSAALVSRCQAPLLSPVQGAILLAKHRS